VGTTKDIASRAEAFGMKVWRGDGTDFFAVHDTMREVLEYVRSGAGPAAVEFDTERFFGHFEGDPQRYRGEGELDRIREQRDCLKNFRSKVTAAGLLTDADLDLAKREADVAIRFHRPFQNELMQRPLAGIRHHLVASPDYLARHGEPKTIADLDHHRLISYGDAAPEFLKGINWILELGHEGSPRAAALTINNSHGVLQAVEAGAGIAALPSYLIRFSGKVQVVLPQVEGPVFRTFFTYPSELRRSLRIAVLREFLVERMTNAALDM
jgi:hypothetical protein